MWHFVYKLFYWRLSAVETLTEWLHWDAYSCLFHIKTSGKDKGMIEFTRAPRCRLNWGLATSKSAKTAFIAWISQKYEQNLKDETLFLIKSNNI